MGTVQSLIPYFYIPKGPHEIRVIFNRTSCGLNKCLFVLRFSLPAVSNLLHSIEVGTYQSDSDYQEVFYNFLLHRSSRLFTGVDVTHIRTDQPWELERLRCWERFCPNYFGQTDSPFCSIQMSVTGKQLAYSNRKDETNPYHWDTVILNHLGDSHNDATQPWFSRSRRTGGWQATPPAL